MTFIRRQISFAHYRRVARYGLGSATPYQVIDLLARWSREKTLLARSSSLWSMMNPVVWSETAWLDSVRVTPCRARRGVHEVYLRPVGHRAVRLNDRVVSPATVNRDWAVAQVWLCRELARTAHQ